MKKLLIAFILSLIIIFSYVPSAAVDYVGDLVITESPWIDSRAYSDLNALITAIGSTEETVFINREESVATLSVPTNVSLIFGISGAINNSGRLNIQTTSITADNHQIFTGSGEVDFAVGTNLRSTWFSDLYTAFNVTNDNYVTLIINSGWAANVTASVAVGDNVTLKWEGAGNRIVINSGFTLSNIKDIEAGKYQIFAGSGNLDFVAGSILKLSWFNRLRSVVNWIGSVDATIVVDYSFTLDYSETIPLNITLERENGAIIADDASNSSLTINGSFISESSQAFDWGNGTGNLILGALAAVDVSPKWFGAVGDSGTNDTTKLNQMFDSMTSGGSILVDDLYYGNGIIISNSDITIRAIDLSKGFESFAGSPLSTQLLRANSQSNILIDGVYFNGNSANVAGSPANGVSLLRLESVTDSKVTSSIFEDNLYLGFQITSDCRQVVVEGNIFKDLNVGVITQGGAGDSGNFYVVIDGNVFDSVDEGISLYGENDKHITISNNNIQDSTVGAGIIVRWASNFTISGNNIYNMREGIRLFTASPPSYGTIVGNTIDTVSLEAIEGKATNVSIVGNTISNGTIECIRFSGTDSNISNNLVTDCGETGIYLEDPSIRVNISNNVIKDCAADGSDGIRIVNATESIISNNLVIDTTGTPLMGTGISVRGTSGEDVIVSGNNIHNATTYGIYILDQESAYIFNNYVENAGTSYSINYALASNVSRNNFDEIGEFIHAETVSSSIALSTVIPTRLNSGGGVLALTLADGTGVGQQKLISMVTAGNNADVTIAKHETSDPEVARFDAADEYLLLVWTGTEWATVNATCTFP